MEIKVSDSLKQQKVNKPEMIAEIFRAILAQEEELDRDKEHIWVVGMRSNVVQYIDLASFGILNASLVHPREVFRMAILRAVTNIILVHNHPSGFAEPSEEDKRITSQIKEAGRIVGITVLDHVIITDGSFFSFNNVGLL